MLIVKAGECKRIEYGGAIERPQPFVRLPRYTRDSRGVEP